MTIVFSEFPVIRERLRMLAFRKARAKRDEGSELYVNESGQHGIVSLRPERFAENESFIAYLRHEFMHLHDMVDENFAYVPKTELRVSAPSQQRLALERYAL